MTELSEVLDRIWGMLGRGTVDRHSAWRFPCLGTVADGAPRLRTVVLRGVARADWLEVHTDARSAKVAELAVNPAASLHVWDPKTRWQVRIEGRMARVPAAEDDAWARLHPGAREVYGTLPAPGAVLAAPDPGTATVAERQNFRVLRLAPEALDWLELGEAHRRARWRAPGWEGAWLAP